MNIADGTYAARPGAASVYESEKGALVLALVVKIENGPDLKSYHTLVNKDGAINTRTVDNLKAWSGWNGVDPFWFMENDLSGVDVEVVIANEPGFTDPSKLFPKVKWVNPPGGGMGGVPDAADRRTVLAKYGAKFRALAGGVPCPSGQQAAGQAGALPGARTAATAATPATMPARSGPVVRPIGGASGVPPAPPAPPTRAAPALPYPTRRAPVAGATQATAWARLCALGAHMTPEQREEIWFAAVDATGMDQADMTADGWAQVTAALEARLGGAGGAVADGQEEDVLAF